MSVASGVESRISSFDSLPANLAVVECVRHYPLPRKHVDSGVRELPEDVAMKIQITTAALLLAGVPAIAQSAMSGVSNPDQTIISATSEQDSAKAAVQAAPKAVASKPSAATTEVYGAYVPYSGAVLPPTTKAAFDPDANIVTETTRDAVVVPDDSGIVTSVPERDGEVREGTLLKARIGQSLSTTTTLEGQPFTAPLTEAVLQNGRVILPAGSVLEGRVTEVRGGKRISGSAALHLEARSVTLPDGTHYVLHAQLIDTDQMAHNKLNSEGTVGRRDHPKENLAIMSLTTGSGAVAGAMLGGGVGAIVGAGLGAGVSTILWLKEDRQAALPKDSLLVFSLTTPMILKPMSDTTASASGLGMRSSLPGTAVTAAQ